jgi:cytochrome c biogenesis protein CcmG/thiol:disulfide interchange protein DsbE
MRGPNQIAIIMDAWSMSKSNLSKLAVIVVLVVGAILVGLQQRRPRPVAIGDPAPIFTLPGLDSGSIALRNYQRRVVVLNFWATWCPPCVEETPSLVKFAE